MITLAAILSGVAAFIIYCESFADDDDR